MAQTTQGDQTQDDPILDQEAKLDEPELDEPELEVLDEDALETEAQDEDEEPGYGTNVVVMDGREFVIEEPSLGVVLGIVRVFAQMAVRGERAAFRQLSAVTKAPTLSTRVVMLGALGALQEADLVTLAAVLLQFDDFKTGRKWLRAHTLRLAPLIRAFFLNLSLSEDLRDSMNDFFTGIQMTETTLSGLMTGLGR